MRDLDNQHIHGTDRDGKWSTGTVVLTLILGFTLGFFACHELYSGLDISDITRILE